MLLRQNMDSTESLVMMRLDTARNRLLRADVTLNVVTLMVAVGSLITGAFGMNVRNGIEESQAWFVGIIAAIALSIALVSTLLVALFRLKGIMTGT